MNETLLTISLLLMNVSLLGIVGLLVALRRDLMTLADDSLIRLVLHRLSEAAKRQRDIKATVRNDAKLTRQRIAQVKTRLADEERQDQAEKSRARREGARS